MSRDSPNFKTRAHQKRMQATMSFSASSSQKESAESAISQDYYQTKKLQRQIRNRNMAAAKTLQFGRSDTKTKAPKSKLVKAGDDTQAKKVPKHQKPNEINSADSEDAIDDHQSVNQIEGDPLLEMQNEE